MPICFCESFFCRIQFTCRVWNGKQNTVRHLLCHIFIYCHDSVTESHLGLTSGGFFPPRVKMKFRNLQLNKIWLTLLPYDAPVRGACAEINNEFIYRQGTSNWCVSVSLYYRTTANEKVYFRSWVVYSKNQKKTLCFGWNCFFPSSKTKSSMASDDNCNGRISTYIWQQSTWYNTYTALICVKFCMQ